MSKSSPLERDESTRVHGMTLDSISIGLPPRRNSSSRSSRTAVSAPERVLTSTVTSPWIRSVRMIWPAAFWMIKDPTPWASPRNCKCITSCTGVGNKAMPHRVNSSTRSTSPTQSQSAVITSLMVVSSPSSHASPGNSQLSSGSVASSFQLHASSCMHPTISSSSHTPSPSASFKHSPSQS